jgi:hypothetical protein
MFQVILGHTCITTQSKQKQQADIAQKSKLHFKLLASVHATVYTSIYSN